LTDFDLKLYGKKRLFSTGSIQQRLMWYGRSAIRQFNPHWQSKRNETNNLIGDNSVVSYLVLVLTNIPDKV
jgi:hypothetical protein